jgi:hypothetical protein
MDVTAAPPSSTPRHHTTVHGGVDNLTLASRMAAPGLILMNIYAA